MAEQVPQAVAGRATAQVVQNPQPAQGEPAVAQQAQDQPMAQQAQNQEEEGDLARVLERLKKLEDSQKKSVESVLEDLQHLIRSPLFQKDQAIDYLVNLKIVAKETKHARAGFYSAVLTAMQNKMWASNMQFKRYLEALLGDKEDEVVLKRIAAVDKALRVPGVGANRFMPRGRGRDRSQVQCFQCGLYGHYQRFCSSRPQPGPQSKRPRLYNQGVEAPQKQ